MASPCDRCARPVPRSPPAACNRPGVVARGWAIDIERHLLDTARYRSPERCRRLPGRRRSSDSPARRHPRRLHSRGCGRRPISMSTATTADVGGIAEGSGVAPGACSRRSPRDHRAVPRPSGRFCGRQVDQVRATSCDAPRCRKTGRARQSSAPTVTSRGLRPAADGRRCLATRSARVPCRRRRRQPPAITMQREPPGPGRIGRNARCRHGRRGYASTRTCRGSVVADLRQRRLQPLAVALDADAQFQTPIGRQPRHRLLETRNHGNAPSRIDRGAVGTPARRRSHNPTPMRSGPAVAAFAEPGCPARSIAATARRRALGIVAAVEMLGG